MGSRLYFCFLPNSGVSLDFCSAAKTLSGTDFSFGEAVCTDVMDENYELIALKGKGLKPHGSVMHLCEILKEEKFVDADFGSAKFLGSLYFGSFHESPLFAIAWPERAWLALPNAARLIYERLMIRMAINSNATTIIRIGELRDFYQSLTCVDGVWLVDTEFQYPYGEFSSQRLNVWSDGSALPIMRNLQPTGRVLEGYTEFREQFER